MLFPELTLLAFHSDSCSELCNAVTFIVSHPGGRGSMEKVKVQQTRLQIRGQEIITLFCFVVNFIIPFLGTVIILTEFKIIQKRKSDLLLPDFLLLFKFLTEGRKKNKILIVVDSECVFLIPQF